MSQLTLLAVSPEPLVDETSSFSFSPAEEYLTVLP